MAIKSWLTAKAEANPYQTHSWAIVLISIFGGAGFVGSVVIFLFSEGFGFNDWLIDAPFIPGLAFVSFGVIVMPMAFLLGAMFLMNRADAWYDRATTKARLRTVRFVQTNSPRRIQQDD